MVCSTIRDILVQAESKFGAEDAIRYKGHKKEIITKSYTQLKKDSAAFSSALRERGMDGRHIALTGPTSYEWIVSFLGIVNSGSIAVPLDVSLPVDEMCDLINRSDAEVFVMDEVRADVGALVRERCPNVKYVISMQKEEEDGQSDSFWQLLGQQKGGWEADVEPDQLCTIMFTSGTTGKSKGVMLTQRNLAENATCLDMKIPERTVILSVLPIHHAYCLSMDLSLIHTSEPTRLL